MCRNETLGLHCLIMIHKSLISDTQHASQANVPGSAALLDVFFSHSQRLPKSITPNLSFIPRNFYYRMSRDEGCLRLQTPLLLSVFSGSPFPAWGSDRSPRASNPPPPSLLLLLLTPLFSCKWECCFSVVIPNDKEVCNLNTWRQTSTPPSTPSKISTKCPLNACEEVWRKRGGGGGSGWARTGRDGCGGGGHIVR